MHDLEIAAADAVEPAALHAAFRESFSDYLIGAFDLPLDKWPYFLARQAVDLSLSRVALRDGEIAAFAFVAQRREHASWRLATMGAPPAYRGSGAAPRLLNDFVQRARDAGCTRVELECFAQNERALKLYRSRGFEPLHALHGYTRAGEASVDATPHAHVNVEDVALEAAFAWIDGFPGAGELPLQVTSPVLRVLEPSPRAWRYGSAQCVFVVVSDAAVMVQSLLDRDPAQPDSHVLVEVLVRAFPAARITVPQLQRSDVGGEALQRAGFAQQALFQWWMAKRL